MQKYTGLEIDWGRCLSIPEVISICSLSRKQRTPFRNSIVPLQYGRVPCWGWGRGRAQTARGAPRRPPPSGYHPQQTHISQISRLSLPAPVKFGAFGTGIAGKGREYETRPQVMGGAGRMTPGAGKGSGNESPGRARSELAAALIEHGGRGGEARRSLAAQH